MHVTRFCCILVVVVLAMVVWLVVGKLKQEGRASSSMVFEV